MSTDPGPGTSRVATDRATGTDGTATDGFTDGGTPSVADGRGMAEGRPYPARSAAPAGDVRHDRIRWGAVWTGTLTTLAIYILLQLLFGAFGVLDLNAGAGSATTRAVVSGVLALVAFFVGGLAAGASALWTRPGDGMVNAVVSWALTVVVLLLLAIVGGGVLAGVLGSVAGPAPAPGAGAGPGAAGVAQQSAGWAALALGLTAALSAAGGAAGAKLWPGRGDHAADRR